MSPLWNRQDKFCRPVFRPDNIKSTRGSDYTLITWDWRCTASHIPEEHSEPELIPSRHAQNGRKATQRRMQRLTLPRGRSAPASPRQRHIAQHHPFFLELVYSVTRTRNNDKKSGSLHSQAPLDRNTQIKESLLLHGTDRLNEKPISARKKPTTNLLKNHQDTAAHAVQSTPTASSTFVPIGSFRREVTGLMVYYAPPLCCCGQYVQFRICICCCSFCCAATRRTRGTCWRARGLTSSSG